MYYIPQDEDEKEFICATEDTSGMHKCTNLPHFIENGRDCTALLEDNITGTECIDWNHYYTDCQPGESNPFDGAISFDNIGLAWVAIFLVSRKHFMEMERDLFDRKTRSNRYLISFLFKKLFKVISLEGWTDVLYFVQDAHSFWNWLYFVLLIVVRSDKNQLIISKQV